MGRLGNLWAHAHFDYEPDVIAIAKGMGAGFPVGAFLGKKKFTSVWETGDHGTTYGGNPLGAAVVRAVVGEIMKPEFLHNVKETGAYFLEQLNTLKEDYSAIEDVRGIGLMIGVDTTLDIKELLDALLNNGMTATQAGRKTLRLTPPLIFTHRHVDEAIDKLRCVLADMT